jgi:hypothetical protein
MASTGLIGPRPLTEKDIDAIVKGVGPGAYALGRDLGTKFVVDYVGRSDEDLNARLKQWVGSKYTHFKYGFWNTSQEAFWKECRLFHDFGGTERLDNKVHPARPKGTSWTCPVDGCDALR